MSVEFINIAYDNFLNKERVLLITPAESSPIKRLIGEAKENGMLIDCSQGKKTKSVIFLDSDHLVLSALSPDSLQQRLSKQTNISDRLEKEVDENE